MVYWILLWFLFLFSINSLGFSSSISVSFSSSSNFAPPFPILILVFCCYRANYHKHRGLKQHRFIISQFPWVRSLEHLGWVPTRGLKAKIKVRLDAASSGGLTRERSASTLPRVLAEFVLVVFLQAVGWRSPPTTLQGSALCKASAESPTCFKSLTQEGPRPRGLAWWGQAHPGETPLD